MQVIITLGCGENWFSNLVSKFYMAGGTLKNEDVEYLIDKDRLLEIIQGAHQAIQQK